MFETIHFQLERLLYPKADCMGEVIGVRGFIVRANKDHVLHFVHLIASKVIVAIRSVARDILYYRSTQASTEYLQNS